MLSTCAVVWWGLGAVCGVLGGCWVGTNAMIVPLSLDEHAAATDPEAGAHNNDGNAEYYCRYGDVNCYMVFDSSLASSHE